ncbi:MAG: YdeI/OmpD-associated family protein [Halobacteriota archaeon]
MRQRSLEKTDHYYVADRAAWRVWLKRNHAASHSVWLVYDKAAAGKRRLSYDDIVDEAVSFGWIDSRSRSLNAERAMLYLSPRKRKSFWARSNKERVARLVKQGLMTDAGLAVVEAAKMDGSWDVSDAVEQLSIPSDLEAALVENEAARQNFAEFSPSNKKQLLWYVASAKHSETRQKRIARVVNSAVQNKNPLTWAPNKE